MQDMTDSTADVAYSYQGAGSNWATYQHRKQHAAPPAPPNTERGCG